jgi:hypothetical protein
MRLTDVAVDSLQLELDLAEVLGLELDDFWGQRRDRKGAKGLTSSALAVTLRQGVDDPRPWLFSPRGHPPPPLRREGERTGGEREIPPPGDRGTDRDLAAGDTAQLTLCRTGPPVVAHWGPGRAKTLDGGSVANPPTAGRSADDMNGARNERRAWWSPVATFAQGGGSGPKAVRIADRNEVERVITRSPGWRCA